MKQYLATPTQMMSSQEIADLLECRHDTVKLSMERLADKSLITITPMAEYAQINGLGKTKPKTLYHVNERDSYVVVAQLSPEFTAKLVDRWQELESKSGHHLPQTFSEALQLAAIQAKQLEIQAPKVAYFNALVERNLLTNIRDTAKEINCRQNEFVQLLINNNYVYRDAKNHLKPYAQYTPSLFQLKEFINPNNGKAGLQMLVTPLGRETLRLLLEVAAA